MSAPVYGTSVFCDDIRNEIDGKVSLIGCYGPAIQLPAPPPIILPKLGIHIMVISEDYIPVKSLKLKVFAPGVDGGVLTIIDVAPEFPPEARSPPKKKRGESSAHTKIIQDAIISPFEILSTGTLRVVVNLNGTEIAAGVLRILGPDEVGPQRIQASVTVPSSSGIGG